MEQVQSGDLWLAVVGSDKRKVTIIGPADAPGWWRCYDLATGVEFVTRQGWLIERVKSGDD